MDVAIPADLVILLLVLVLPADVSRRRAKPLPLGVRLLVAYFILLWL